MKPEDCYKTAFVTRDGKFEFNVLSFGLCNAPGTFQCLMNQVFDKFLGKFVLVYFDDIMMIYSQSVGEHREQLKHVFEALRRNQLFTNPNNCIFLRREIEFVANAVSEGEIKMDRTKIAAIQECPIPTKTTEMRSFLGLANYYRRFIQGFVKIAGPLHDLSSQKEFRWTKHPSMN